ncbi:hypothetical protein PInf_004326 [Phytophthora infestans]|nr:hypothetical protein PInf_004326 [Phytophthora infestans]
MVCATYKTTFAMMAALAISSADATGTCYAPWHHSTVNKDVLKGDIQKIGQFFSSFRTFETRMSGLNVIDIAAEAGVKVSPGVQMNDLASVDAEIQAVCDGYKRNPSAVDTIWVGNECLQNGDFGTVSANQLVGYIQKVKECTGGGVPVGTVQRINEWNSAPGVDQVAGACDKQGANIYPFFTQGEQKPIEKLEAQWKQMTSKYDAGKIQLTETGWPTEGETSFGNTPSLEIMQEYLNDFVQCYTGAEYEKHFGCFDKDGNPKVSIPGGFKDGSTTTTPTQGSQQLTGSQTQQGTPVPTEQQYAVDVPEYHTEAPGTPSANDGATYAVDVPEYRTEAPTNPTGEIPAQDTPAQETPVQGTPSVDVPTQDVPTPDTPSVTPAPVVQSGKDCAM